MLNHYEGNEDYKVFEIATCSSCHTIYLIGKIENGYLEQSSAASEDEFKSMFLLAGSISDSDEDHSLADENIDVFCVSISFLLCPAVFSFHLNENNITDGLTMYLTF